MNNPVVLRDEVEPSGTRTREPGRPHIAVLLSLNFPDLTEPVAALHRRFTRTALTALAELDASFELVDTSEPGSVDVVVDADGLLVLGGGDIAAACYGGPDGAVPNSYGVDAEADRVSLKLIRGYVDAGRPVLGICRGSQLINVCYGGTIIGDITDYQLHRGGPGEHLFIDEKVEVLPETRLAVILGAGPSSSGPATTRPSTTWQMSSPSPPGPSTASSKPLSTRRTGCWVCSSTPKMTTGRWNRCTSCSPASSPPAIGHRPCDLQRQPTSLDREPNDGKQHRGPYRRDPGRDTGYPRFAPGAARRVPFSEWRSGAHIDVTGPTGVLRQYSLAGSPKDDSSMWVAVKKEGSKGGSAAMHELKVGDHLKISKPRNMLGIAPEATKHILIAGGIGLTPLMSMAFELYSWGADFELHYFARSREEMAFDDFLTERVEYRDFVTLHIGVPRTEQPALFQRMASATSADTHVYTCGPEGFMDQVVAAFTPRSARTASTWRRSRRRKSILPATGRSRSN